LSIVNYSIIEERKRKRKLPAGSGFRGESIFEEAEADPQRFTIGEMIRGVRAEDITGRMTLKQAVTLVRKLLAELGKLKQ
jgi:hypothetical protein